jgi:hypothetical protein
MQKQTTQISKLQISKVTLKLKIFGKISPLEQEVISLLVLVILLRLHIAGAQFPQLLNIHYFLLPEIEVFLRIPQKTSIKSILRGGNALFRGVKAVGVPLHGV